ncbi:hypothetical protein [Streptomyces chryseus]|uniref:hypothetical protein n=1 Tax=Streptomyces chryseus TaxID=68186 RepID=UPI00110F7048|nr:hypothetical protein [Streptomyces chryseus]
MTAEEQARIQALSPTVPDLARTDLTGCQQADVFKTDRIPLLGSGGNVQWLATPDGVVIVSQTCDVVQPKMSTVQVAPVVRLAGSLAGLAAKGSMPRYVPIPEAGAGAFADLEHVATVAKSHLALLEPQHGALTTTDIRKFGMRVGRRYSRFAFPDDVSPWLAPLKDSVLSKAGKSASSLGRVLEEMVESLRLECVPSWDSGAPYHLTLLVLIKPGLLPVVDDLREMTRPADLDQWLYDGVRRIKRSPAEVADQIISLNASSDRLRRLWLWEGFGESLAAVCKPKPNDPPDVQTAVAGHAIDSEVATIRDVSYERALRSEEIDVEHLSPPLPR